MGFNISGLVINKNYENNFDELQKELGWNLEKESEIDFEDASSNWIESGVFNVYFSEKGTLIFLSMEMTVQPFCISDANTLTFALSETAMAFNMHYCENGNVVRTIIEHEDDRVVDQGEKLPVEEASEDTSEIIWNQIEVILGKRFWDIELDEKAIKYVFAKEKEVLKKEKKVVAKKKWWQFW